MSAFVTRCVFADTLKPGMVLIEDCRGSGCYKMASTHEAGKQHTLQILDLRVRPSDSGGSTPTSLVHAIVMDEDGQQNSWISGANLVVRVTVTEATDAPADVTP